MITAALGLITVLAWNGPIQAIFAKVFRVPDIILAMPICEIVVTIIVAVATIVIARSIVEQW